jgi:AhpD family alkylhydroperoxidase
MSLENRHTKIATLFQNLKEDFPKQVGNFVKLTQSLEAEGAIGEKVKELILVALAIGTKCDLCIANHIKEAAAKGASREEILEAAMMAVVFGGGQSLMQMHVVYEELEYHFD